MIYYKDYPGFTYESSTDDTIPVWQANFSEDFVFILSNNISSSLGGFDTLEEAMQAIRCNAIMEYFDDEY